MGRLTLIPRRPTGRVVASGGLIAARYPLIGLGPELNPDPFFNDPGAWIFGDGWSIDQNVAKSDGSQIATSHLQTANVLTAFRTYRMQTTITVVTEGRFRQAAGGGGSSGQWISEPVFELTEILISEDIVFGIRITADNNAIGDCTYLSCREVLVP